MKRAFILKRLRKGPAPKRIPDPAQAGANHGAATIALTTSLARCHTLISSASCERP
jgi:hypothetical protein